MLDSITRRKTAPDQVRFRDAQKFIDNGYVPAFCEFGFSQPHGYWVGRGFHTDQVGEFPDYGVSIITGARPTAHLLDAANTWLVHVTVRCEDRNLAASVDAVITQHLRYRDGVVGKHPVRHTQGSLKRLHVFAFDPRTSWGVVSSPFDGSGLKSRRYRLPKSMADIYVEFGCAMSQFVHSGLDTDQAPYGVGRDLEGAPLFWTGGDLTQVRREELPLLSESEARTLSGAVVDTIEAHPGAVPTGVW